jgi:hypothetical protein
MLNNYLNERVKRIPLYVAIAVFCFKYKRLPYYMEYEMFKFEKRSRQVAYTTVGIIAANIVWDLSSIIYKNI